MTSTCRSWWCNCIIEADSEVLEIDRLEGEIARLTADVARIRELISGLELCHQRAERWVHNIIEAIGLGQRSPWKEWQVNRVRDRIPSLISWPPSSADPVAQYVWILFADGEHESFYRAECPAHYKEHEDFWLATVQTIIHDTDNGDEATLSLGLAIDVLWPCHWRFVENLQVVLEAIGGRLNSEKPFAACGRNINLSPIRDRMGVVSGTLMTLCGHMEAGGEVYPPILALLGQPPAARKWLAASLEKTIRLQLDPPADARAMSALNGPDWIKQGSRV